MSLRRFIALSGVKEKQIVGAHWQTWNDAKREAGLGTAAFLRPRLAEESVVPAFAALLVQLGKWPTESALRLAKRRDGQIPSVKVSRRLENDPEFMEKLRTYCEASPQCAGVVGLITERSRKIYLILPALTPPLCRYRRGGFPRASSGRRNPCVIYSVGRVVPTESETTRMYGCRTVRRSMWNPSHVHGEVRLVSVREGAPSVLCVGQCIVGRSERSHFEDPRLGSCRRSCRRPARRL